jgi:allantoicase
MKENSEMTMSIAKTVELPANLKALVNLADPRMGSHVHSCSDEFFAKAERMLHSEPAQFITGKYDEHGKWMDGWETRRKREAGHDWCIIRLGSSGRIAGFDIDTSFFTGNYPAAASIEACYAPDDQLDAVLWQSLLPNSPLQPDQHHLFNICTSTEVTHLRLNIFPDGGIARLRVYGEVVFQPTDGDTLLDLVALKHGGRVVAYSDAHFGHPNNLLNPGRGVNMGDGWETARRRAPGYDWCILQLGQAGRVESIEVDTAHFKGNFPAFCSIQAIYAADASNAQLIPQSMFWPYLLAEQPLSMDQIHRYGSEIQLQHKINYIRLNMIPDGGISRIRLWGKVVA